MPDLSEETLTALKKIADWADYQKKITKWSLLALIPIVLLGIGVSIYFEHTLKDIVREPVDPTDWYDVRNASRKGDLEKALSLADELLERTPLDFEGHYTKGEILIRLGQREAALASFKKAEEIFPLPEHKAAVDALTVK